MRLASLVERDLELGDTRLVAQYVARNQVQIVVMRLRWILAQLLRRIFIVYIVAHLHQGIVIVLLINIALGLVNVYRT